MPSKRSPTRPRRTSYRKRKPRWRLAPDSSSAMTKSCTIMSMHASSSSKLNASVPEACAGAAEAAEAGVAEVDEEAEVAACVWP